MEFHLQVSKNYSSAAQDSDCLCCSVEQNHQHKTQIH